MCQGEISFERACRASEEDGIYSVPSSCPYCTSCYRNDGNDVSLISFERNTAILAPNPSIASSIQLYSACRDQGSSRYSGVSSPLRCLSKQSSSSQGTAAVGESSCLELETSLAAQTSIFRRSLITLNTIYTVDMVMGGASFFVFRPDESGTFILSSSVREQTQDTIAQVFEFNQPPEFQDGGCTQSRQLFRVDDCVCGFPCGQLGLSSSPPYCGQSAPNSYPASIYFSGSIGKVAEILFLLSFSLLLFIS